MIDRIIKTEKVSWEKLKPYQTKDLKKTKPELLDKLKRSLRENGFASPFYVWQRGKDIISLDGHHRIMVLNEMKLEGEKIPEKLTCNFLNIKTEKEAKLIFLAYQSHYSQMTKSGFTEFSIDMDMNDIVSSFEPFKLNWDFAIKSGDDTKLDKIPEKVETISKLKDLYELKSSNGLCHKVYCGSTAEVEDVKKIMDGELVDMIFTDPPYGVSYSEKIKSLNKATGSSMKERPIIGDNQTPNKLYEYLIPAFKNMYEIMSNRCSYYVTAPQGGELWMMMMMMMKDAGMLAKHIIIWNKNSQTFSMKRLDYDYKHEPILYGWKKSHKFYGAGEHKTSVWDIPRPTKSKEHPTMKPVELIANAINNSTKIGDIVFDGFGGSGSTLIACEQSNRNCRLIEIEPHYVDVIISRWKSLVKDGEVFRNGKKIEI